MKSSSRRNDLARDVNELVKPEFTRERSTSVSNSITSSPTTAKYVEFTIARQIYRATPSCRSNFRTDERLFSSVACCLVSRAYSPRYSRRSLLSFRSPFCCKCPGRFQRLTDRLPVENLVNDLAPPGIRFSFCDDTGSQSDFCVNETRHRTMRTSFTRYDVSTLVQDHRRMDQLINKPCYLYVKL